MIEGDFERYWLINRKTLLSENKEYREIEESYRMHSGFDWLLWGLPAVAGLLAYRFVSLQSEILKWLVSALAVIVVFLLCVWIKSTISGLRSLDEVEKEIKAQAFEKFKRKSNHS